MPVKPEVPCTQDAMDAVTSDINSHKILFQPSAASSNYQAVTIIGQEVRDLRNEVLSLRHRLIERNRTILFLKNKIALLEQREQDEYVSQGMTHELPKKSTPITPSAFYK